MPHNPKPALKQSKLVFAPSGRGNAVAGPSSLKKRESDDMTNGSSRENGDKPTAKKAKTSHHTAPESTIAIALARQQGRQGHQSDGLVIRGKREVLFEGPPGSSVRRAQMDRLQLEFATSEEDHSELKPAGWTGDQWRAWWFAREEGLDAVYSLAASVNHPTNTMGKEDRVEYARQHFGQAQVGTRGTSSTTSATNVPQGGPDGFRGAFDIAELVIRLCDETEWLASGRPSEQAVSHTCEHCLGTAIAPETSVHGCFGLRQEARLHAGRVGMPEKASDVDAGFTSSASSLGLRKRRLIFAWQVTAHAVFGLQGSGPQDNTAIARKLETAGVEFVDAHVVLETQGPATPLFIPVSNTASQAFRRANAISAVIASMEGGVKMPLASVSDGPFWDQSHDAKVAAALAGGPPVRPCRCAAPIPCPHWSLQEREGQHACMTTFRPDVSNRNIRLRTTRDNEPPPKSRQNQAKRVTGTGAHGLHKRYHRFAGTTKVRDLHQLPCPGRLRFLAAFLRQSDPMHTSVPASALLSIGYDIANLRLT